MNNKLYKMMNWPEIEEIIYSDGDNPHRILGAHKVGNNFLVQAFYPDASEVSVYVENSKKTYPMELADEAGFYAVIVPYVDKLKYKLIIKDSEGVEKEVYDPYAFGPTMDREDFIKFGSGIHYHIYEKLGAHLGKRNGVEGCTFAVWAPSAARVSVIGDFNNWDGRLCQMHRLDPIGVFEIFIPGAKEKDGYQFEIKTRSGLVYKRPDPYAIMSRGENGIISVISSNRSISWTDSKWLSDRKKVDLDEAPLSICEISLEAFAGRHEGVSSMEEITGDVLEYVENHGFDTIELMPVMKHLPGHFYHILDFFALDDTNGTPEEFMKFIDRCHEKGIRVIMDWVPTFFPKSSCGLSDFDGKALYEYEDPRVGIQPRSGDLIFDYGRKEVTNFLISNALYWIEVFHIDGLRTSDISKILYLDYDRNPGEWSPNIYGGNENLEALEFLKQLTTAVHKDNPGVLLITKETACWPQLTDTIEDGGLGFDYKWNNGWTRDFLSYMENDPLFRAGHHDELTFSLIYSYTERFILAFTHEDMEKGLEGLYYLMPGDSSQKMANLRLALSYMMVHPGRKHLYMEPDALTIDQSVFIENMIKKLNDLYFEHAALHELDSSDSGFEWINNMAAEECMVSFARKSDNDKEILVVVANFAGVERQIELGVPADGRYTEVFNSDDVNFGGQGILNEGKREAKRKEVDGRDYSIKIDLAPASLSILSYAPYSVQEKKIRAIKEEEEIKKEKEREEKIAALKERQTQEEEQLLRELKLKYERELAEQEKAIEEKYEKIEEEKIFKIVSEEAVKSISKTSSKTAKTKKSSSTTKKTTTSKKTTKKKPTK
ncbi:1,4-alpha-glucan branching enzyme [Butyrivibrio sp. INlla18]|uniref:1,4-alpha-glucan branching protein GlgB n=1 Tax=Butyrivibrio sp. INlla18 TaxID=1520806 RepID=UPI000886C62C|nr:1,4-alpha-glucan branching protein GlgB [Butyrivibrio sp. INlla18]SDA63937.1 1,4-alpha-glucan branching enzyme [Butyrivibrio sp. INlla18]